MKILVTGAAGFIGSHLVEGLLREGHQVVGIDNFNDYYSPVIKRYQGEQIRAAGCTLLELELATDDLMPYVDGIEAVYHCAAQPGISANTSFSAYICNNVFATQHLLQSLTNCPTLRMFVNIATSSIYGVQAVGAEDRPPEPISYYGVTKLAAEQLVMSYYRQKGLPATSLRLFSVYGARERPDKLYPRLIHSILDGIPFPLYSNSWQHKRSFTFVGDVVSALLKALNAETCIGEIINLGTTESISTGRAIETVERILGRSAHYIKKPARAGDQEQTAAVIEKAARILGYFPDTSFEQGILSEIDWFQSLPDELRSYYSPRA